MKASIKFLLFFGVVFLLVFASFFFFKDSIKNYMEGGKPSSKEVLMTHQDKPKVKYRKDYKVPTHLVERIDLHFDLGEDKSIVTAKSLVRKNPKSEEINQMVLNGEEQVLKYVRVNDKELLPNQYELTDRALTLKDLPDEFALEIQSEIKPQENSELEGLYRARNIYATQCEAEGFRRITYFLDRPDVMAKYTTTIIADKKLYPVLLSNGNLIDSGELEDGRHWVKWEDPFKKPSYLFALVGGDLEYLEDHFVTKSGRKVTLRIFCEKGYTDESEFAMTSLKKAMIWDEENYGREYDLDLYMIVAISDFNSGAMENKGLNIFNSKYIFAKPDTATDRDYELIDSVIAHEYFHNWTGNRITCRDWFQLSLKEGLTRFRDQSFSEDIFSHGVKRIDDTWVMKNYQFSEDQSPLAHPVRPDSYMEIRNFYTVTVYEKGAEVIRMMKTILGDEDYRKGMDIYFDRFDGQAVTCDDFVGAMEEGGSVDLTQFKLWYSQAGTPELYIKSRYDADKKQYTLDVEQVIPKTPGQDEKLPMHIPLKVGLLDADGKEIPLRLLGEEKEGVKSLVLNVTKPKESFVFVDVKEEPVPSLLRHFSAPVKLFYDYSDEELAFLMANDNDDFARFEASQIYMQRILFDFIDKLKVGENLELPEKFISSFKRALTDEKTDKALIAALITMPADRYLSDQMKEVDVDGIHQARQFMAKSLAENLKPEFEKVYQDNLAEGEYKFEIKDVAKRTLKNTSLGYLTKLGDSVSCKRAVDQYRNANNMTDQFGALAILNNSKCKEREGVLDSFYKQWRHEPLVVDKWFAVQSSSYLPGSLDNIKKLLKHPDFNIKNPNRVYSLLRFGMVNPVVFHDKSGDGYRLFADQVLILNKLNANVAARLAKAFSRWRRYDADRQELMKEQLERILKEPDLSENVYEVVSKSLK